MNFKLFEEIRLEELHQVLVFLEGNFPEGIVLELGAGTGWQARELDRAGYKVTAIDLANSNYAEKRVWPIIDYDGEHLPFSDASFDVVFSSNVLEHIENLPQVNREILRVLKLDGLVIHIVPSATWRLWSIISHYFVLFKISGMYIGRVLKKNPTEKEGPFVYANRNGGGIKTQLRKALFPARHGIAGNTITEVYWFSARRWKKLFENSGWYIRTLFHNRLFYTGRLVMGNVLPLATRRVLSTILGSSCHVFVLSRKAPFASIQNSIHGSEK